MSKNQRCIISKAWQISLEQLQDHLYKKVPRLNHGGCIRFAYYFSKYLTQHNVYHKITFVSNDHEMTFNTKARNSISIYHVLVYIPKLGYIDGHASYTYDELVADYHYIKSRKLTLKQLSVWMNDRPDRWNPSYKLFNDTKITKAINIFLNDSLS